MRINESRLRQIIREEARRVLGSGDAIRESYRIGKGDRAETGSNLDWLIGFVGAYPGELHIADLRRELKVHRGIPHGRETRGFYSSTFAQPDRIRKYVDVAPDGTLTLNAAGEERLEMMSYPQSAPDLDELQDAYGENYRNVIMDRESGFTRMPK